MSELGTDQGVELQASCPTVVFIPALISHVGLCLMSFVVWKGDILCLAQPLPLASSAHVQLQGFAARL